MHDALCVLQQTVKDPRTVFGGGAVEMLMAEAVGKAAAATPGKMAIAMEAFATALRRLPGIIADNGGYDSAELVSQLRAAHATGNLNMGLGKESSSSGFSAPLCLAIKILVPF